MYRGAGSTGSSSRPPRRRCCSRPPSSGPTSSLHARFRGRAAARARTVRVPRDHGVRPAHGETFPALGSRSAVGGGRRADGGAGRSRCRPCSWPAPWRCGRRRSRRMRWWPARRAASWRCCRRAALVAFADVVLEDGVRPAHMVLLLAAAFAVLSAVGLRSVARWGQPGAVGRGAPVVAVLDQRPAGRPAGGLPAAVSAILLPWALPGLTVPAGIPSAGGPGADHHRSDRRPGRPCGSTLRRELFSVDTRGRRTGGWCPSTPSTDSGGPPRTPEP